MKTAIYIEDGVTQLVITPESDFEKNVLSMLGPDNVDANMFMGSFYDCRGGWVRQSQYNHTYNLSADGADRSLIIRVDASKL